MEVTLAFALIVTTPYNCLQQCTWKLQPVPFQNVSFLSRGPVLSASYVHCVLGGQKSSTRGKVSYIGLRLPREGFRTCEPLKIVFLDVTLCQLLDTYLRFGRNRADPIPLP